MKILFVQRVKAYAGSERYFTTLVPELIRRGIECKLLFVVHPNDFKKIDLMVETIKELNIPCEYILSKRKFSFRLLKQLNSIVKREHFDLIHVHLIQAEFWFSLIKRWMNKSIRLVSTIHGFDEKFQARHGFDPTKVTNSLYVRILKFNQPKIERYIAVSHSLKNLMEDSGIIPKGKISVVYYGANYPEFRTPATNDSSRIILVPGRLVPYKGQDLLIEAVPRILKALPEVEFHLAGDLQGEFGFRLYKRVKESGLSENVKFLGHVKEMESVFSACEIVVLPSRSEGFGLVLTEAFNAKKPVIAFDVPAFNEVIEHEKTGILCKPFDTNVLADEIIRLLDNPQLQTTIGNNAREKLLRDFSLDRMADETIRFYKGAILGSLT